MNERTEKDFLGERAVPADAYWGIHTLRARENFSVSGTKMPARLIRALATVKKACAQANLELGFLDAEKAGAIIQACEEIMAGQFAEQFVLDALQGGAGTSSNMNMNEVIANRAMEIRGGRKGDYARIHPLEDVNKHQSTNDVYPTALKVALIEGVRDLSRFVAELQGVFQKKEKEFAGVVKIGRTEMQEAVPMTLGAEFSAFAEAFGRDRWRTFKCEERLRVVNLGGTAVGTGLGAPRRYIFLAVEKLRQLTGLGLSRAENLVDATANADAFVEVSGILQAHASNLIKIANDLRLLSLLGEIILPQKQVGSSIMPGKVNPVIPEMVIQAGIKVMANDRIVGECAARGTLQINEFLPLLGHAMLESLDILEKADRALAECAGGIAVDREKCREHVDRSTVIVTAFLPQIGYDKAGQLLKEFREQKGQETFRSFLERKLGRELVDKVLSPESLTALGYSDENNA